MTPEKMRDLALKVLDDMKGIDILSIDVRPQTSLIDYMIICTGRSTRHVKALADAVNEIAKKHKASHVRTEGGRESEWILVDLGDVVAHIMLATTRSFYSLEDLWEPVKEFKEKQSHS